MRAELSPRERVNLALAHHETDRVPVDIIATDEAWDRLRKHLNIHKHDELLVKLGIDFRHPRMRYIGPPVKTMPGGGYIDHWGLVWQPVRYAGGVYEEVRGRPLENIKAVSELAEYPWPDPAWWDVESLFEQIQEWDREIEYMICLDDFGDPGGFFEISWYMRGMELFMEDLVLRPELAFEIIRRVTQVYYDLAGRVLDRLGDRIDIFWTSDDIAHQRGLMMSLPMWRNIIQPHHQRFNRLIHERGSRVMYHSCGAVMPAIPDLIETGIDILDVLQFSARGMDPKVLKQQHGHRLSFHGGVDIQQVLPHSTAEEVRENVRDLIHVLGAGGGYIVSPTHNIQVDIPPENVMAIYEAAQSVI